MIASVDRRFVLLCNPKTGTTALETAFGRFAEIRVGGAPKWKHIPYDGMRRIFGNYFERTGCTLYAAVRDPIDTLVSWYKYRSRNDLKDPGHPGHDKYCGAISFSQFVDEWSSDQPTVRAQVGESVSWCLTRQGGLAPLQYYRYENLPLLVDALATHVGTKPVVNLINRSPRKVVEVNRESISRLPKMARALELYETIPFVR